MHVACRAHIILMQLYKGAKNKQTLLTFSNDLLNSDLVPPDSEGSADEISARMTGPRAATSSSRTGPGVHQLPARIEELPHVGELTRSIFAALITRTHTHARADKVIPVQWIIALIYNAGQIVNLEKSTLQASLFAAF